MKNNQFSIDFDCSGMCAFCHIEIATFSGSTKNGKPVVASFLTNNIISNFRLDDNSIMPVNLCKSCYDSLSGKDIKKLMKSIIEGWKKDVEWTCSNWTETQKKLYIDTYSKRYITEWVDKPNVKVVIHKNDNKNLEVS